MSWFEVRLQVSPEAGGGLREAIVNRLFELGAEGVDESQAAVSGEIVGFFDEKAMSTVPGELKEYLNSLGELFPESPSIELRINTLPDENWSEKYKEFFEPQPMGSRFYLLPVWRRDAPVPERRIPLLMEPGQAFGTGLHPTTQLCVGLIERALKAHPRPEKVRMLDVGTGTGILSVVAAKLGVTSITATDIDPLAVEASKDNFVLNSCADIEVSDTPITKLSGPFDLIVSNILLETHKELWPSYARLLRPGGQIILSGLLTQQKEDIDRLVQEDGFLLELAESRQEWLALLYVSGMGS